MARGDTGKWVARAGATGGGRSYRGQMPVKWYSSLVLICLLGVALIVYSRYERQHPGPSTQPAVGAHWFLAVGFDVCGTIQPNLPANPNASVSPIPGIRTAGDGVIQVAPTTSQDSGNNATLARFVASYPRLIVQPGTLQIPGKPKYTDGKTCPTGTPDAGKRGQLEIKMWPSFTPPGSNNPAVFHDPAAIKLADGQLVTVAFVPSGASVPKPSATAIQAMLTDRAGSATSTSSTVAPPLTPTSTATTSVSSTTATTKPASSSTTATTKPASSSTTPTTTATSTTTKR